MGDNSEALGLDENGSRRDRQATERALRVAAREWILREGILGGLNLRELSDMVDINRGLIYQYFGSRRDLLRAAIVEQQQAAHETLDHEKHFALDFSERRINALNVMLAYADTYKLATLGIIDGDDEVTLFPFLASNIEVLRRDVQRGVLQEDDDPIMLHVLSSVAFQAFCVYREKIAYELEIDIEELDRRASLVFRRVLACLENPRGQQAT